MQLGLFEPPRAQPLCFDRATRIALSADAWVDFVPGCVAQHHRLFEQLARSPIWTRERTRMYERTLDVPRLLGSPAPEMESAAWVRRVRHLLSARYERNLSSVSFAYYRDGRDSVAMHADEVGALRDDTVIAVVSLGQPRTFLLKPATGGTSRRFRLGHGDLLVMGGSCQRDWLHGVPKCKHANQRISVMFRETTTASAAQGADDSGADDSGADDSGADDSGAVYFGAGRRAPASSQPLRGLGRQPPKRVAGSYPT